MITHSFTGSTMYRKIRTHSNQTVNIAVSAKRLDGTRMEEVNTRVQKQKRGTLTEIH